LIQDIFNFFSDGFEFSFRNFAFTKEKAEKILLLKKQITQLAKYCIQIKKLSKTKFFPINIEKDLFASK